MFYKVITNIKERVHFYIKSQIIWVKSDICTDDEKLIEKMIKIIKNNNDKLDNPYIFDEYLYKTGKCTVEVIPYPNKPDSLDDNFIIDDKTVLENEIYQRTDIDYRSIAEDLIWRSASSKKTKNEGSMYYMIDVNGYEDRGCPKGSIHPFLNVQSWICPKCYHELTWKELCIELKSKGWDTLISDGHDYKICEKRKDCHAFFKDDPEHECCNGWKHE